MRMTPSGATDVTYIGFLLGHGGDALQMLDLAAGIQERRGRRADSGAGDRVHRRRSSSAARRSDIDCERTPLITASMDGPVSACGPSCGCCGRSTHPIVHFHTGNACLPTSVMTSLELLRYRRCFVTLQSPYETMTPGQLRARFWATTARAPVPRRDLAERPRTEFQVRCGVPDDIAVVARNSIHADGLTGGDGRRARAHVRGRARRPDRPVLVPHRRAEAPVEAVEIFAGVAAEFPTAVLVFVGRGDEEQSVEAEAARLGLADRVRLMGYRTDIPTGSPPPPCGSCRPSGRTSASPSSRRWPPAAPCCRRRAAATTRSSSTARTRRCSRSATSPRRRPACAVCSATRRCASRLAAAALDVRPAVHAWRTWSSTTARSTNAATRLPATLTSAPGTRP